MKDRPNIIVMTTHDTGRHFGCYGYETVHTPAIDGLARDGYRFTNYFACSSVCVPSRSTMMTGRYPQSHGQMCMPVSAVVDEPLFPWDWQFNEGERHLSHILQAAGYYTALIGFQHEAFQAEQLGFDARLAEMIPWSVRRGADEVAAAAAEFLKDSARRGVPFYAQIGFFETHFPLDFGGIQPDSSQGVFVPPYIAENETAIARLAQFQGSVRKADGAVGVILEALKTSGLARDTIVVFTVDHGPQFPRAKYTLYDPGIAVALIVRWPGGGLEGGRTCPWLLSNVDFLPTLLELIGLPVPERVEGVSFAGAFSDPAPEPPREEVFGFFHSQAIRCIRTERHKLLRNFAFRLLMEVPADMAEPGGRALSKKVPAVQLFDLAADPNECHDVAPDPKYAAVRQDLDERLWRWLEQVNDPILNGPVPTPAYFEAIADYRRRKHT
ncbi:MAG: sulfatase [Kiritimatiellae bacterium]|nr:sulfatase [Kiritimatiellia bacterium]